MKTPTVLMVLDGWGVSSGEGSDAIAAAKTPVMDSLFENCPDTTLSASGSDVGLPDGQIGNSEVGHLNMGAGRIVFQDLTRINNAIRSGEFDRNPAFQESFRAVKNGSGRLHIMGLMSDGGVHSHIDQIKALTSLADSSGVAEILVHAFMDGRDTPPQSGIDHIRNLESHLASLKNARVAVVSGRFYAMDRDSRWDRVEKAYRAMFAGEGMKARSGEEAVLAAYGRKETDEFILPTVIEAPGIPAGLISDGDGIIFMNFRGDRAREITHAINDPDFSWFDRPVTVNLSSYVCLAQYDESFQYPVAFPPVELENLVGEIISNSGLTQLRIAETEKYAHVTFFFNGGKERLYEGEDRCLVPSPKDVPTYDLKPRMSADLVTEKLLDKLGSGKYDFVLVNYANPDMVGHTGVFDAAVEAIEAVDGCIGLIAKKVREVGGVLIITSDHGNAESMVDPDGTAHTAHTTHRVPLLISGPGFTKNSPELSEGKLADVAPTLLKIMGLSQPPEMTGSPLF